MSLVISIDPGHKKCGLLLADILAGHVLEGYVVKSSNVIYLINIWHAKNNIEKIVLGNGTSSRFWELKLIKHNFKNLTIVDEKGTTLRSRERYWELWPPVNFLKLLPRGILLAPQNLDALAAMILLEDFLDKNLIWIKKPSFKIWPE